jgi:hypothetical protein
MSFSAVVICRFFQTVLQAAMGFTVWVDIESPSTDSPKRLDAR